MVHLSVCEMHTFHMEKGDPPHEGFTQSKMLISPSHVFHSVQLYNG